MHTETKRNIDTTPDAINVLSEHLARLLVKISKNYERKEVDFGNEEIVYEIYTKAITSLYLTAQGNNELYQQAQQSI